jgi:hypothetical protein
MSYLECTEQEIPFDSVEFEVSGKKFYCSGVANHVVYKNDNGIGTYEFWGHRERHSQIEWNSELSEMTIDKLEVSDSSGADIQASDEMLEEISREVFEYTYERAEEKCG